MQSVRRVHRIRAQLRLMIGLFFAKPAHLWISVPVP